MGNHNLDVYFPSALPTYFGADISAPDGTLHMKQAFYIYRSTYAGFNSLCGSDFGYPLCFIQNVSEHISVADQEAATRAVVVNFIDALLRGDRRALAAVRDYRLLGSEHPDNYYLSLAEFSDDRIIKAFEEGELPAPDDRDIRIEEQVFRDLEATLQGNRALRLRADADTLSYELTIPDSLRLESQGTLAIDVYNHMDRVADFAVEMEYVDGTVTRSRAADYFALPPRLEYHSEKRGLTIICFGRHYDEMGQIIELPAAGGLKRVTIKIPPRTNLAIDNIRVRAGDTR